MPTTFDQFAEFAQTLDECADTEEVWSASERFGRAHGLPRIGCAYAGLERQGTLAAPAVRTNFTTSRIEEWAASKLYMRDPSVKRAQDSKLSFCWGLDYIRSGNNSDPKLRTFYRDLASSIRSMFVVPLPRVDRGALGMVMLGNAMPAKEFEAYIAERKSLLTLASIYADRRMIELLGKSRRSKIGLLPREAECLEWLATGDNIDGVTEHMSLSVETVNSYLQSAKRKLRAQTTEQAIAVGLKLKLIRP